MATDPASPKPVIQGFVANAASLHKLGRFVNLAFGDCRGPGGATIIGATIGTDLTSSEKDYGVTIIAFEKWRGLVTTSWTT